jgi:hypothetical protein
VNDNEKRVGVEGEGDAVSSTSKDNSSELLITGTESKHWELVQAVNEQFRKGITTTVAACEAAGVGRRLYYQALQSPYVQQQRLMQIQSMNEASSTVLEKWWLRIMMNMAKLAASDDSKESVQAARFVREVMKDLEVQAQTSAQEERGAVDSFMEQFITAPGSRKKYKARRKKGSITEEIEVEIPGGSTDISGGNEIIDA